MKNREFLHYTTGNKDKIQIGSIYETNWEISNYWKMKINIDVEALKKALPSPQQDIVRLIERWATDFPLSFRDQVKDVFINIFYTHKIEREILNEYVFEDIRMREFSNLLSRRNCMFLIDADENLTEYLSHFGFEYTNRIIIRVEILETWSEPIKVNPKFLDCGLLTINEVEDERAY